MYDIAWLMGKGDAIFIDELRITASSPARRLGRRGHQIPPQRL